jgi:hypothetical protein
MIRGTARGEATASAPPLDDHDPQEEDPQEEDPQEEDPQEGGSSPSPPWKKLRD